MADAGIANRREMPLLIFNEISYKKLLFFLRMSGIFRITESLSQQVDIEKYLAEFRSEIGSLNRAVKDLSADNARINRRVESQNVEIKSLKSENADLRNRLSKYEDLQPTRNSGNSSLPPSKEKLVMKSSDALLHCE